MIQPPPPVTPPPISHVMCVRHNWSPVGAGSWQAYKGSYMGLAKLRKVGWGWGCMYGQGGGGGDTSGKTEYSNRLKMQHVLILILLFIKEEGDKKNVCLREKDWSSWLFHR